MNVGSGLGVGRLKVGEGVGPMLADAAGAVDGPALGAGVELGPGPANGVPAATQTRATRMTPSTAAKAGVPRVPRRGAAGRGGSAVSAASSSSVGFIVPV
jgi:hypothetical protein